MKKRHRLQMGIMLMALFIVFALIGCPEAEIRRVQEIENVEVNDKKLKDIAEIKKSFMYDYILVDLLSESSIV